MRLPGMVLALALVLPVQAQASEALWNLLKGGGQVVIMRHASTDSTAGDRDTMRLEDCSTQRNLSAAGRDDARRIGDAFRARGIGVDDVRSSVWCRCLDTATLAFGAVAADHLPHGARLGGLAIAAAEEGIEREPRIHRAEGQRARVEAAAPDARPHVVDPDAARPEGVTDAPRVISPCG